METKKGYSVLLADDEEEVVRIIMQTMDWEGLGFQPVGYVHNGMEALDMCEENMPDVVLTDIKMPFMDGLTLGRKLKEKDPQIKLIIFSGFDEFEYAKEAIKLEVEEYLLKPIDMHELTEVFTRVRQTLDKERGDQENLDRLRDYYMDSLPLLQESFFTSLIEGRIEQSQLPQYLNSYQIRLDGPFYLAAVIHVSTHKKEDDINLALRTTQVRRLLQETVGQKYWVKDLTYLRDIVMIVQFAKESEIGSFTDTVDAFCRQAAKLCGCPVTAGIGNVCMSVMDLPQSYQGAQRGVSYRAIYGNTRAINIAEIDPGGSGESLSDKALTQEIIRQVRLGDPEKLEQTVSYCVSSLHTLNGGAEHKMSFLLTLLAELTSLGNESGLAMEEIVIDPGQTFSAFFNDDSDFRLKEMLLNLTQNMQNQLRNRRESAASSFVQKAVEYIREHYREQNIAIETVCHYLGVSAAYFSTVFKKETGKTFISYLTDYRMEKAVDRLLTSGDKTYQIAEQVGYSDSNYFSYVFKKQFGMSPSKYRQQMKTVS